MNISLLAIEIRDWYLRLLASSGSIFLLFFVDLVLVIEFGLLVKQARFSPRRFLRLSLLIDRGLVGCRPGGFAGFLSLKSTPAAKHKPRILNWSTVASTFRFKSCRGSRPKPITAQQKVAFQKFRFELKKRYKINFLKTYLC